MRFRRILLHERLLCNKCSGSNGLVFFIGIFNIYKFCDGQEILVCEEEFMLMRELIGIADIFTIFLGYLLRLKLFIL